MSYDPNYESGLNDLPRNSYEETVSYLKREIEQIKEVRKPLKVFTDEEVEKLKLFGIHAKKEIYEQSELDEINRKSRKILKRVAPFSKTFQAKLRAKSLKAK